MRYHQSSSVLLEGGQVVCMHVLRHECIGLGTEQRNKSTNGIDHPTYFALYIPIEHKCDEFKS